MSRDIQSTTGRNLARLKEETGLNPWVATPFQIKQALTKNDVKVPEYVAQKMANLWPFSCFTLDGDFFRESLNIFFSRIPVAQKMAELLH